MNTTQKKLLSEFSKNFDVREIVTKECWDLLGDHAITLFDPIILELLIAVRAGLRRPVIVNTWLYGGKTDGRGFRDKRETTGSSGSMHRCGKAVDFVVNGLSSEYVRAWILRNQLNLPPITRMEKGVSWVHVDTKHTGSDRIYLFNP